MGHSVLLFTSVVSVLGGLVFGYELGIVSGALFQLQTDFQLSCFQQEAIVSSLLIGALLASVAGGVLIDHQGRRNSILISSLLVLTGSVVLVASKTVYMLVLGRIIVGFGVSLSSMSCCIFVSEMVSPKRRGLLVTLYEVGITVGILAAYAVNYILSSATAGWKYMFGLPIAPLLVQLISLWFLPSKPVISLKDVPEVLSQRRLIQSPGAEEGNGDMVDVDYLDDQPKTTLHLFQSKGNMRTRMVIGLGLVLFQQFTGQPNVLFYASTIFQSVGFQSVTSAIFASVGLGAVKVAATLVSMICADKVGRRALLIGGCLVMTACLFVIGLLSNHALHDERRICGTSKSFENGTSSMQKPTDGELTLHLNTALYQSHKGFEDTVTEHNASGHSNVWHNFRPLLTNARTHRSVTPQSPKFFRPVDHGVVNWIILINMMAYVSAYSIGFGPMTWLVLSEIFPAWVRGRAFALTNCFNWAANLIVTFSFLNLIDTLGLSWTFLLYGLIGVAAVIFIYVMIPETKGKSLEEIDKELSENRYYLPF